MYEFNLLEKLFSKFQRGAKIVFIFIVKKLYDRI